jgi:AAA ATPase domain
MSNINAYCQDNQTSWLDWGKRDDEGQALTLFVRKLIMIRHTLPVLRWGRFLTGQWNEALRVKDVERARQSITKAIRAVTERIARSDAELGKVFSSSIKTGTFCTYQPDPDRPISWEFAAIGVEPPVQAMSRADETSATSESQVLPSPLPFATAQRTAFVGRESETVAIRAAIDRACDGSGSLLMLGGGPGVGKTRLALETGEYAARNGFAYFLGRCYERDEPLPYLPFVELIEAMLAQTPSREEFRRRIGENAAELAQLAPRLRRVFSDIPALMELPD